MSTTREPISEPLRRAIFETELSYTELAERTGLDRAQLCRFAYGRRSLTLRSADKLAAVLGFELVRRSKGR